MSNGFTYAYPGGYAYQKIDPSSYKFSKVAAFSRPPTPPAWKPPTNNPFGEEEEKAEDEPNEAEDAEKEDDGANGEGAAVDEEANGAEAGETPAEDGGKQASVSASFSPKSNMPK